MSASEERPEKVSYDASCHCGATKYTVKIPSLDSHQVNLCNCSICTTNGYLLVYPEAEDVIFHSGFDQLKAYRFGRKTKDHRFCPACGSSLLIDFHREEYPWLAINVRMFKDIEPDKLKYRYFDGKNRLP